MTTRTDPFPDSTPAAQVCPDAEDFLDEGVPGRDANAPDQMELNALRQVAFRTLRQIPHDNINLIAAGVAFFSVLAVFPGLTAAISLYGLFGDPSAISLQLDAVSDIFPDDVVNLVHNQMARLMVEENGSLAFGVIFSTLIALWSANNGIRTFSQALTIVHGETTRRGFFSATLISLGLTMGALTFFLAAIATMAVLPVWLSIVRLQNETELVILGLRWLVLFSIVVGLAMAVYRWGPDRKSPRWRWLWPGAILGSLVWIVVSIIFSTLLREFGLFNSTYGPLAAVIAMISEWPMAVIQPFSGSATDA